MLDQPRPQDNHLLAALSPEVQSRLFPHLELVELELYALLYEFHGSVRHVYFPTDSVISLYYLLEDGASSALSIVGNEGLIGLNLFLAEESVTPRTLVQHAGSAYRLSKRRVKAEFDRHGEFMLLTLRYTQALITTLSQATVCNRHHSIAQQLCSWLLFSLDHVQGNSLTMTQEFLCHMLGVRREGITEAAINLQQLGVITYARGRIKVIDRPKLEVMACECYRFVKTETDLLIDYRNHPDITP